MLFKEHGRILYAGNSVQRITMIREPDQKRCARQRGFSLVEIAILMVIVGIMIIPLYSMMVTASGLKPTEDRMRLVRTGLAEYYRIYGYMPCPAPINATPNQPNYDIEDRDPAGARACLTNTQEVAGLNGGTVLIGALPVRTMAAVMGCEDTSFLPAATGVTVTDMVARQIDSVSKLLRNAPATEVNSDRNRVECIEKSFIADEHGNKFLYAVARNATVLSPDPFNNNKRQIQVLNAAGTPATTSLLPFIVLSHGPDGNGATSYQGTPSGLTCAANPGRLDAENCDGSNAVFRNALYSEANNNNFFDDTITFSLAGVMLEADMWNWAGANNTAARDLRTIPNGRVFVGNVTGATSANDRLIVNGAAPGGADITINVRGAAVNTGIVAVDNSAYARQYCYSPRLFATAGCP